MPDALPAFACFARQAVQQPELRLAQHCCIQVWAAANPLRASANPLCRLCSCSAPAKPSTLPPAPFPLNPQTSFLNPRGWTCRPAAASSRERSARVSPCATLCRSSNSCSRAHCHCHRHAVTVAVTVTIAVTVRVRWVLCGDLGDTYSELEGWREQGRDGGAGDGPLLLMSLKFNHSSPMCVCTVVPQNRAARFL